MCINLYIYISIHTTTRLIPRIITYAVRAFFDVEASFL